MERHTATDTAPLRVEFIRIDGGTQPRAAIAQGLVAEYAEAMTEGAEFPPIDVFFDGAEYWLADGFHRYHAAKKIGLVEVPAKMHAGTRREAVLFSVGVNHGHGLRRTNADKRKAVMTLLADEEWAAWSNSEIARRCGVQHQLVGNVRSSLGESPSEKPSRVYTTKHGTKAKMSVEHIGKGKRDDTKAGVKKRVDRVREMAADGHTVQQIAADVGLKETGVRKIILKHNIDVPADRAMGRPHRPNATRIVERMIMDAEHLTADVGLIDFSEIDPGRFGPWIETLNAAKQSLNSFIRRLTEERKKHVEAA